MSILTLLDLDHYLVFFKKLINGYIGINVSKLKMKEFTNETDNLKKGMQRISHTKQMKKMSKKILKHCIRD